MSTTVKQTIFWSLFTLAHAGLTILLFLLYVNYAMKVDHGLLEPTITGTVSQYLKSIVFLPILLPVLRWHADLATGPWIPSSPSEQRRLGVGVLVGVAATTATQIHAERSLNWREPPSSGFDHRALQRDLDLERPRRGRERRLPAVQLLAVLHRHAASDRERDLHERIPDRGARLRDLDHLPPERPGERGHPRQQRHRHLREGPLQPPPAEPDRGQARHDHRLELRRLRLRRRRQCDQGPRGRNGIEPSTRGRRRSGRRSPGTGRRSWTSCADTASSDGRGGAEATPPQEPQRFTPA